MYEDLKAMASRMSPEARRRELAWVIRELDRLYPGWRTDPTLRQQLNQYGDAKAGGTKPES